VQLLAHSGLTSGADTVTSALLAVDVGLFAWFVHVRKQTARRWLALSLPPLMIAVLVASVTASAWVPKPTPSGQVLDTNARLEFVSPTPGEVVIGSKVRITLKLTGGRIVPVSDVKLRPDAGHVHLFLDDRLVSMAYGLSEELSGVSPGEHSVKAEFVAANHRSWLRPVLSSVPFRVAA
jgi:hypothetical protein